MDDITTQVIAGLIVAAISFFLGWNAHSYRVKQRSGRDSLAAQANEGAAAFSDIAVGKMHAETGGMIEQHIGDRIHFAVPHETQEERALKARLQANKKAHLLAVHILRTLAGEFYKDKGGTGLSGLPGHLWSKHEHDWQKICLRIGKFSSVDGHFTPLTEPNQFTGEDDMVAETARTVLRWYVWAENNCPDFEVIRIKYALPTADEARAATTI